MMNNVVNGIVVIVVIVVIVIVVTGIHFGGLHCFMNKILCVRVEAGA